PAAVMNLTYSGPIWYWRGPAPFYFITVPEDQSSEIQVVAPGVTYGWGMIPVSARIGGSEWDTSLWPKDGGYVLPIKTRIRVAEGLGEGDTVVATMTVKGL